ncbi:MAG: hypothetical protein RKK11_01275 [Alphaproteobacteria bacterium]
MTSDWEFPTDETGRTHIPILQAINYAGEGVLGDDFKPRYVPWIPEGHRCLTVLTNDRRYRRMTVDPDRVGILQPPTVWDITRAVDKMITESATLESVTEGWPETQRSDAQGLFNIRAYSLEAEMQAEAIFNNAIWLIRDGKLRTKAWVERRNHGAWVDVADTYWGSKECRTIWHIPIQGRFALIDMDEADAFEGKYGKGPLFWNRFDLDAAVADAKKSGTLKQPNQSTVIDRSAKVNSWAEDLAERLGDGLEVRADPQNDQSPMIRSRQDMESYIRNVLGGTRQEARKAWDAYFPNGKDGRSEKHQWRARGRSRKKPERRK